jgi:hypothetical protein
MKPQGHFMQNLVEIATALLVSHFSYGMFFARIAQRELWRGQIANFRLSN